MISDECIDFHTLRLYVGEKKKIKIRSDREGRMGVGILNDTKVGCSSKTNNRYYNSKKFNYVTLLNVSGLFSQNIYSSF